MTLKIYGVLRSRASRTVWLAKELGISYELVPVIQAYRVSEATAPNAVLTTASPAFRAVNPNGLIPSINDDGFVMHESLAINLYLAKKHGGDLAPQSIHEDALMTMWSVWAMTECEPHTLRILQHRVARPEAERDTTVVEVAVAALQRPFGVLEAALQDGDGHLIGERFTVADLNLAEVFRYAQAAPELFSAHPAVNAWIERCQARPAFKEMVTQRNAEPA